MQDRDGSGGQRDVDPERLLLLRNNALAAAAIRLPLGSGVDPEDVASQVVLELYPRLLASPDPIHDDHILHLARRAAIHRAIDELRRRRPIPLDTPNVVPDRIEPERAIMKDVQEYFATRVHTACHNETERAFVLRVVQCMEADETPSISGIGREFWPRTPNYACRVWQRVREKLLEWLRERGHPVQGYRAVRWRRRPPQRRSAPKRLHAAPQRT